jgi:uncharacterized protein (DUF2141 family)
MLLTIVLMMLSLNNNQLQVVVRNIEVGEGNIVIEIYNNEDNFLNKPIATRTVKATNESLNFNFDLPNGAYAVSVFQDRNQNKKCDKNWFSIPTEPYGLSNNFRPSFSKPKFNDCKFTLLNQRTETVYLEE